MSNYKLIHTFNENHFNKAYLYKENDTNRIYISITPPNNNFLDLKKEINYNNNLFEYLGKIYKLPIIERFTNKTYRIRIVEPRTCYLHIGAYYYAMMNYNQMLEYWFPDMDCIIVNENEEADIAIVGHPVDDNTKLKNNEVNIFITIENLPHFGGYAHYKKYKEYDDKMIDIFVYNHINKINITNDYIVIPTVYFRMNYFINNYNNYYMHSELNTTFKNKKFCLIINKSGLNSNITIISDKLKQIDNIDNISIYNDTILNKSCYNSIELLKVFNKYKFIICFENSYNDGYITEKIFNCLFAKTIPIYAGSDEITNYINNDTIIHVKKNNEISLELIKQLNTDEALYNKYIESPKVNMNYLKTNTYFKELYINTINKNMNKM